MYKEAQAVEVDERDFCQTNGPSRVMSKSGMIDNSLSSLSEAVRDLHNFIDSLNGGPDSPSVSLKAAKNVPSRPFMEVINSVPEMIEVENKGIREAIVRLRDMLT